MTMVGVIAFWIVMALLALALMERWANIAKHGRRPGYIVVTVVGILALVFSFLRELWLEPILASGPPYLKLVSIVVLLVNIALVFAAFIIYMLTVPEE